MEEKTKKLEKLNKEIVSCTKCPLYQNRTQAVPGYGNPRAKIIFIGEAPGREEDIDGIPFVGRSGKLLSDAIGKAGFNRKDFYITNINKCRPPENRTPTKEEIEKCFPFLKREIEIINPEVICLVGATAAKTFLGRNIKINKERGRLISHQGKKVFIIFHPAYVLRGMKTRKSLFYKDVQKLLKNTQRSIEK